MTLIKKEIIVKETSKTDDIKNDLFGSISVNTRMRYKQQPKISSTFQDVRYIVVEEPLIPIIENAMLRFKFRSLCWTIIAAIGCWIELILQIKLYPLKQDDRW